VLSRGKLPIYFEVKGACRRRKDLFYGRTKKGKLCQIAVALVPLDFLDLKKRRGKGDPRLGKKKPPLEKREKQTLFAEPLPRVSLLSKAKDSLSSRQNLLDEEGVYNTHSNQFRREPLYKR